MGDLNSQLGGKEEEQGPYYYEKGSEYMYYRQEPQQQDCRVSGWARTGLEPEVNIEINTIGVHGFIDTGSTLSTIDTTFFMFINKFIMFLQSLSLYQS